MQTFRLRVAFRDQRGVVRPPVRDEIVRAANLREAISALLSNADSLIVDGTNLAWLTDNDQNMVWSLRMDEHNAETT
ncbi:cell division GTPase FtsZ [Methylobacterium brachythecii]|uniref:Cell division GTPase FtsZ n=1 Tax=Methylobacterium brachythecii TaxID=1176177 RepID=A0A7W6AKE7_9HYPH|nr:cell division GTPase FtsZ [Methylobacterium brachythecii]